MLVLMPMLLLFFQLLRSGKAVYWDLKSEQSLGAVTATLKPGVGKVEARHDVT